MCFYPLYAKRYTLNRNVKERHLAFHYRAFYPVCIFAVVYADAGFADEKFAVWSGDRKA